LHRLRLHDEQSQLTIITLRKHLNKFFIHQPVNLAMKPCLRRTIFIGQELLARPNNSSAVGSILKGIAEF
jgi:hypothetical protein